MASLSTANQLPRTKPYSVKASTAYWLHVGTKRHVAGRNGETMCRYSWINRIRPRAAALPAA
ncbi:ribonuclease P [Mycobacterium scrofulaceum]|nr:ribonuclease P [Mycobacterium scrofulaceum]